MGDKVLLKTLGAALRGRPYKSGIGYCVVQDVSSMTNDVCSDESSFPRK